MECLQTLLHNSTTPVLTAFLLGLLTAISPCPLATNIAAIGYIGKDIKKRRRVFLNGLLYTAGRIMAYTVLGIVLILIIRRGASMFGIQKFISTWSEILLGPALIVIGLLMIFSHRLHSTVRFQWKQSRRIETSWRLGRIPLGRVVRHGLLSIKRHILFRHTHPHVSNSHVGLPATRGFCFCHRPTRTHCCLATGVQHAGNRQVLRMDEGHRRLGNYHRGHIVHCDRRI